MVISWLYIKISEEGCLIGNTNKTNDQHCELEVSRIKRDVKGLQIIHSWFTENYPFPEKA